MIIIWTGQPSAMTAVGGAPEASKVWFGNNAAFAALAPATPEVIPPGGGSKLPDQNAPQDAEAKPWKPPQWLLDRLDREEEERIRAEVERRQALLKGEAPSTPEAKIKTEGLVTPNLWEGAEKLSAEVIERITKRQPIQAPAVLNDDEEVILLFLMDL